MHQFRIYAPILGLLLAIGICLLTPYNNIYLQATPLGGGHFPLAPFCIFFGLVLLSLSCKRWQIFSRSELLTIWIQCVIASGISYTGFARTFLINITAPEYYAGNGWAKTLAPYIPQPLIPRGDQAVQMLYSGIAGGREMDLGQLLQAIPWKSWTEPLLAWAIYIVVAYLVMIFILNIILRQWIYYERMSFPLLTVPKMVSEAISRGQGRSFFSNRFFLAGLALPIFLHLVNGLNFYYPSVPQIPTLFLAGPYFNGDGLLGGFHKLKIYIFPAFIGFAFITSRQISFSFWFFFLLAGLFYGVLRLCGYALPASELGITFGPTLTRPEEMQMIGAYGIFFIFLIWMARKHLLQVLRIACGGKNHEPGPEWISLRASFWGAFFGIITLVCWYSYYGTRPLTALMLLLAFYMVMIVATRIICQGGLAYFTLTAAPSDGLIAFFGQKFFAGASSVLPFIGQKVLFVDLRESLMPSLLHAAAISENRTTRHRLFFWLLCTIIISLVASSIAMLLLCYRYGMRELQQDWAVTSTITVYEKAANLLHGSSPTGDWVYTFALLGAGFMIFLVLAYHRFYWWPLHPLGYLTAYSSSMRILWFSFFIGWLCNTLCMRYGGVQLYKRLQLLFVGMIIGDFCMGGIWAMVGLYSDMSYQVLPN